MRRYIVKRLLLAPITLIGVTLIVFCLTRIVPGGPVDRILQEQVIASLSGEKTSGINTSQVSDAEREKLEDLFNLNEPIFKAYLQWLGILRSRTNINRAEFSSEGRATITLSAPDGSPRTLDIQREGLTPRFHAPAWFSEEGWKLIIEPPKEPSKQHPRTSTRPFPPHHEASDLARRAGSRPWRAVIFREEWNGLLQGNLGSSYKYNEPVLSMILSRLPVSLYFGILAAIITYLISIPLGVFKTMHHGSWTDSVTSILVFIGYAVPGFALGAVLLIYLGARLEYFPLYGLTSVNYESMSLNEKISDLAAHTVLPLTCYIIGALAMTTMMVKNNLMENLATDYMRTAAAKGLSFRRSTWLHALRNAIIPVASGLGGVICSVVGGSILIERVFDIRGFGMLSFQALMDKDYTLIMGTLLLSSVIIILGNLLSDILVAWLDPRIKFR